MSRFSLCFIAATLSAGSLTLAQAATVAVNVGQTVSSTRTLPGGIPLRIKLVALGIGEMRYLPSSIDNAKPSVTLTGLLEWLDIFQVFPQNSSGQTPSFNDAVIDPSFPPDDPDGKGNIRTSIRVRSNGSTVELDNTTGTLVSLSGFRHAEMQADFMNNAIAGGLWSVQNIRYNLAALSATGDLSGTLAAFGTTPAQTVAPQTAATVWTFDAPVGPSAVPLAALSAATSVSNLPTVLQSAGFTVNSVTATEIIFTGNYTFNNINVSTTLKNYMCVAVGCTKLAKNSLSGTETNYLGLFKIPVKMSIPLTP